MQPTAVLGAARTRTCSRCRRPRRRIHPGRPPGGAWRCLDGGLRDVVEKLDEQIRIRNEFWAGNVVREKGRQKPGLSPKSAQYIWSEVTSGFREAGDGALVNVPRADGKGGTSVLMRLDLEAAGLTRAELFRDDERHMPFTFHGLRHTAITHWAVAGRPQHWLLAVAGTSLPR